jgi:glycosyltransferase involved in cell wall biosynthesis
MPYQSQVAASSGGDIARYLSPMKLFEYLACGRAILSSDLPVLQEVLNISNAILLPPDDIETWAQAIKRLQSNPHLCQQLSHQAQQDALRYTWESRASRILEGIE